MLLFVPTGKFDRAFPSSVGRNYRAASPAWWQFGANGFFYRQVSKEEQAGQVVGDGNRGKAIGIGPFLRFFGDGWGTTFKWQRETEVANRAKGDRFYLQVFMRL